MARKTSRRALWIQKIADQVAHSISQRIARGDLAPGDSPGSRDALAAEFVTSLSVIDRALEQLAEGGALVPGDSGGLVVSTINPRDRGFALPEQETRADVAYILELRLGLESIGAALAAKRHTQPQMDAIRAAAEAYAEAVINEDAPAQADFRFHSAIAAASGNPYLSDLLEYLGPLLIPRMRVTLPRGANEQRDENQHRSLAEHRVITEAIAARDSDAARRAMREHLLRSLRLVRGTTD